MNNEKEAKYFENIERVYKQHTHMRDIVDSFLVKVYREEIISPAFAFFAGLYYN